jgi:opacity protein-like surface antigen
MKNMSKLWMAPALFTAITAVAPAQVFEGSLSIGAHKLNPKELADGFSLDDGWKFALRLTLNSWTHFGQEFGYGYNRSKLLSFGQDTGGMAIHQGFYNMLAYATPEGNRIRPFVTGGGHFSNFVPPGASASYGQGSNKFGVNYGGGLKVRVSEKWLVRMDVRQFLTGKPFGGDQGLPVSGSLRQTEYSVGLGFVL